MTRPKTAPAIFYATSNPGKVMEVARFLAGHGIQTVTPADLDLKLEIEETGHTLAANARLKAIAFLSTPAARYPILADDTGVEIDALAGEPGVKVRRWRGYRMSDQEIIDYCLFRMKNIPPRQRQAKFKTVLALCPDPNSTIEYFTGQLEGEIITRPAPLRHPGLPFEVLFYATEYRQMLSQLHHQPPGNRTWFSHRERALKSALPRFRQLLKLK